VAALESSKKTSKQKKKKIWHRCQIWLDCKQHPANAVFVLMWLESDQELLTRAIEYFLLFPMVIYTPGYDQQFRSYRFWKLNWTAEFLLWTGWSILVNSNFRLQFWTGWSILVNSNFRLQFGMATQEMRNTKSGDIFIILPTSLSMT
jgi:hypothetical protein